MRAVRSIPCWEVQVPAMTRLNVNFPWGDIPARPFMGLSDDLVEDIADTAMSFLTKGGAR